MKITDLQRPLAITMWDFSWLERRWPGAGQEDWDASLDALVARGYNAVRIDAYPHLVAIDPRREWELLPCWDQQAWGSPARTRVRIQPLLNEFIRKCADRGIQVGLSTWFREDPEQWRKQIPSPARLADIWNRTLHTIAEDGLLDSILFVDYCNEWPQDCWAPFFPQRRRGGRLDLPALIAVDARGPRPRARSLPGPKLLFLLRELSEGLGGDRPRLHGPARTPRLDGQLERLLRPPRLHLPALQLGGL